MTSPHHGQALVHEAASQRDAPLRRHDLSDLDTSPPPHAESGVRSFFARKGVFITGGSGLVGKVLIEKILRDCPEVGRIFVLLRPARKKRCDVHQRLQTDILDSHCFDYLRGIWPGFRSRCVAVQGDVGRPLLGMCQVDYDTVCAECSIVFHCAATVKFNESLETAFRINVDGIAHIYELCRRLRTLDVLVHVSTAYVNASNHSTALIPEALVPITFDHVRLRQEVARMSPELLKAETGRILKESGNWPNTYCLTKCIGEHVLAAHLRQAALPCVILRPSIVTCALHAPQPGWIDSLLGPSGLVLAVAVGALHVAPGDANLLVDFVPVDIVVNAMIACAWYRGVGAGCGKVRKGGEATVVHVGTSSRNPVQWRFLWEAMPPYYQRHPIQAGKRRGPVFFQWARSRLGYLALHYLTHIFPAVMIDSHKALTGKPASTLREARRLREALEAFSFFTTHEWVFDTATLAEVHARLPAADKTLCNCDVQGFSWDVYMTVWAHGMKVFLLDEGPVLCARPRSQPMQRSRL